jgi:hypothetical protein
VVVLQTLALVAVATYLGINAGEQVPQPSQVVRELQSAELGCPIGVGQPVSFTDDGSVRRGAGTSLYRTASQIFFSDNIVAHAVAALDDSTLIAAFQTNSGGNYVMVGAAIDPGDKAEAWQWSDMQTLGMTQPDQVIALGNTSFAIIGGGYSTLGWIKPSAVYGTMLDIFLAPPITYVVTGGAEPTQNTSAAAASQQPAPAGPQAAASPAVATSIPLPPPILATQDRTSAAILSPTTLAVSFVAGSGANASLFTRIGFVVPGREDPLPQPTTLPPAVAAAGSGASGAAGGSEPPVGVYTWPAIAWGPATSYSGVHLSHAVAAMDPRRYILCFPLDDGITASAGASLVAVAASVVLPPLPAGAASAFATEPSDPAAAARATANDAQIVLGESAVLSGVKAHYYFDAAAMSPTRAVVVFVDAAINDGIRAVLITLEPGLAVSFGATLVLNSGHAGGVGTAGSWLHLSLIPMLAPQFATSGQPLFVGEEPAQQRAARVRAAADESPASVGGGAGTGAVVGASVRKGEVYLAAAGRNAAAAGRRARGKALAAASGTAARTAAASSGAASVRGLQQWQSDDDGDAYFDDDDGYFDDDSSHVVAAQEQVGHPFALAYSNLADNGRVTVLFGEVTPAADLVVTSPQFVVSGPMASAASPGGGGSPGVPVQPACWASATAISASQLVVLDTRYAGSAAASAAVAAVDGVPGALNGVRPASRAAKRARKQERRRRKQLLENGAATADTAEPVMCAPGGMFDAPAAPATGNNGAAAASANVLHACVAAELRPGSKRGSAARGGSGAATGGGGTSSAVGGASGNPWPYYAVAVSNLTLVERLNRPIGIALTDAECASPVTVLMQGTFRYSAGVPQTGAVAGGQTSRRQHHMHNGTFVDAAPVGNPNPIPACNGGGGLGAAGGGSSGGGLRGVASALRSVGGSLGSSTGYPTGPNGEYLDNPGAAACDNSGPYTPGKAYYSDTRGRLVEGPFSGTGGDNLRDSTADSGYLTTIASRYALDGDTSASFDSYLGVATSTWDLLVKIP